MAIANIIIKRGGRVLLTDIKTEVNLEDYIGTHRSVASVLTINIVSNRWYLFENWFDKKNRVVTRPIKGQLISKLTDL